MKFTLNRESLLLLTLTFLVTSGSGQFLGADDTLVEKAVGEDVVFAVLNKIKSSFIFKDDYELIGRIAYFESLLGESPETFPPGKFGGIWQVAETDFNQTKDTTTYPELVPIHSSILSNFSIDWTTTKWSDLLKPLYSGLATRLFFSTIEKTRPIPQTLSLQAAYWKQHYSHDPLDTIEEFVQNVTEWESGRACGGKMDILAVLDSSGSIGAANFQKALNFVADLFALYTLDNVRQGFMLFTTVNTIIFPVENNLTAAEISSTVRGQPFSGGGDNVNQALIGAVELFKATPERPGVPKIVTVFTDAQSSNASQGAALATQAGITTFAVGVSSINANLLLEITSGDPARVFTLTSFDALADFFRRLNGATCEIPQKPGLNETIEETVEEKEKRLYYFDIPPNGLVVFIQVYEGAVESFWSYSYKDPSTALNDGVIQADVEGGNFIYPQGQGSKFTSLYISVTGLEASNSFAIFAVASLEELETTTSFPDTTPEWGDVGPCFVQGFFPDPEDCRMYHICDLNEVGDLWDIVYTCAGDLVWCQERESCQSAAICPCDLQ